MAHTAELARGRQQANVKADLIWNKVAAGVSQPAMYQVGHGHCQYIVCQPVISGCFGCIRNSAVSAE